MVIIIGPTPLQDSFHSINNKTLGLEASQQQIWPCLSIILGKLYILMLFSILVQEKEKLRGLENDEKKTAQYNGFNDK